MKKFISMVLAMVMVLALTIPAFAASTPAELDDADKLAAGAEVTVTGTTSVPTIKVTVPAASAVVLNPYKMTVKVTDGEIDDSDGKEVSDQIISAVQYIENASTVPVSVNAKVKGTANGDAVFAAATTQGTKAPTTKSVFMWLEVGLADADDGESDPEWATSYNKSAANQVLVGTEEATKNNMVTMAAGDGDDAGEADGYCAFKLSGDATSAPDSDWLAADTVDVAITFTFKAVAGEAE